MTNWQKIPQEIARDILKGVLHQFVGPGREYTKGRAHAVLGCKSDRTLDNWLSGSSAPAHHEFMQMCAVFGPTFVNTWLAHLGMTGARDLARREECAREINCKVAQASALLAEALADGHVDHQERARMMPKMRELQPLIENFLAPASLALVTPSAGAASHVSA